MRSDGLNHISGKMAPRLHRWRGVHIGKDVWIGYDAIIETSSPKLVTIRDRATIHIYATIIAHFREQRGVLIEEDATLGPGAIILPNVTIGKGPSWPLGASYRVRAGANGCAKAIPPGPSPPLICP